MSDIINAFLKVQKCDQHTLYISKPLKINSDNRENWCEMEWLNYKPNLKIRNNFVRLEKRRNALFPYDLNSFPTDRKGLWCKKL